MKDGEHLIWNEDEFTKRIYSIIDGNIKKYAKLIKNEILRNKSYSNNEINQWSNDICEMCMSYLYSKMLPFKYIISCYILKNTNKETSIHYSTYWDKADRCFQICWPNNMKDCNMICYVNIYTLEI